MLPIIIHRPEILHPEIILNKGLCSGENMEGKKKVSVPHEFGEHVHISAYKKNWLVSGANPSNIYFANKL